MNESQQNEEAYLKDMAPTLFGAKHEIPSDAPEGYFDALPGKLLQRIGDEQVPESRGRIVRLVNFRNIGIAAGLALLLAFLPFVRTYLNDGDVATEITASEQRLDYADETTISIIDEMVAYETIYEETDAGWMATWELSEEVSGDDIADYLMEEGLHEEVLIETNF